MIRRTAAAPAVVPLARAVWCVLLSVIGASPVVAAPAPVPRQDLAALQAKHAALLENARQPLYALTDKYRASLLKQREAAQASGQLEGVLAAESWLRCQGLITIKINNQVLPHLPPDLLS